MSIRIAFVKQFGEEEAKNIELAASGHDNEVHPKRGSDAFKWAICICIGSQCFEIDRYREGHGIKASFGDLKRWIIEEAHLDSHDGDVDFLGLAAGAYNSYMPFKTK